jgi:phage shock protein C
LLRRSRSDRVIGGVCGGLGRYFGIDPILLRIVAVALALSGGFGVLAYVIAWIVIPEEDADEAALAAPITAAGSRTAGAVVGAALVVVGCLLLLGQALPWLSGDLVWPVVIVAIGVAIVASAGRKS